MTIKRYIYGFLLLLAITTIASCSDDSFEGSNHLEPTDNISYSIMSREDAVATFAHEPLHSQITPLFMDITQQRKGVTHEEWLKIADGSILAPTAEKQHFLDSIATLQSATLKSSGIKLPIEKTTKYIDMTMTCFGGMLAFTSATRIYADHDVLMETGKTSPGLAERILWHEMWHVISRNNPELRKQMYALIGFNVLPDEIEIPAEVKSHILCNPDVERHDSYATFTIQGKPTDCMLLLYTQASEYEEGTSLKDYVGSSKGYWLLALDKTTHKPYRGEDGNWVIYNCTEASDFDKVMSGGNTWYCDDPEECMADNFSFAMISDTTLPNQKLLKDIINTLKNYTQTPIR